MNRKFLPNYGPAGIREPAFKYRIKLLTLCLLKGFKNDTKFKLSTGNRDAPYFNDIIFEAVYGTILISTDYKNSTRTKPLSYRQLFHSSMDIGCIHENLSFYFGINRSTFRIKNVRRVTNVRISRSNIMETFLPLNKIAEDDILYCAQSGVYYTLVGEDCREVLRKQNRDISEDDLTDFIDKFQLLSLSEKAVEREIHRIIEEIELSSPEYLPVDVVANYLDEKITNWVMDLKSGCLENHHAAAFLSTLRTCKYTESLKRFNVTFKSVDVHPGGHALHLVGRKYYVLSLIKYYREVLENPNVCIVVDPGEKLSVQRIMVEAFTEPECQFLVVPLYSQSSYGDLRIDEMLQGISNMDYKRVIFFSDRNDVAEYVTNIRIIESRVSFNDLEESCKNAFLDETVDFQGTDVTIRDVLGPDGNANEIVDEDALLRLSLGDKIRIPKMYQQEDIGSCYICRRLVRDENTYTEREFCDSFVVANADKFVLISDDAGMGKSTVLSKVTDILKEPAYPRFWVIRLDLNRHFNVFRKLAGNTSKTVDIKDILNSASPEINSNFERALFNVPNKVLLLIDGVDVVRSSYKNLVLQFLKTSSARTNVARIILTTRPHFENLLEEQLRVTSFKLRLFSNADRIDFLAKYWKANLELSPRDALRAKYYARRLTEALDRKIGHASLDFIGIPLQTKMIADIFQQSGGGGQSCEWRGCREFLTSANESSVEPNADINIAKLYEMFVIRKGEIFVDDKCDAQRHVVVEAAIRSLFQESIEVHKKIALEALFDSDKCEIFAVHRNADVARSKHLLSSMGLVQRIEGVWIFVHQTFGEYFVATCLWDELKAENVDWPFLRFILGDVLVSAEFSVVRSFFDGILTNEDIPDGVLQACGEAVGQISWHENRNVVRLVKEARLNILKLLLGKCRNSSYLLQIEDVSGGVALHEATTAHLPVMEYLVLKGVDVNRANSRGQSALHAAAESDSHADAVEFLIRNGGDVDGKSKDGKTALHVAAQRNSVKVAGLLIAAEADLNARDQALRTPLHLAAESNSPDVARLLVDAGADVLAKTGSQQSALDIAQSRKSTAVAIILKN